MAVIQRFGGAFNLNVHVHALVLDGVFARNRAGVLNFHATRRLTAPGHAEVLATVEPRIRRLLDRRGLGDGDDDDFASHAWADESAVLAGLAAASVQGTVALGPLRGARLRRLGDPPESVEAPAHDGCHARANGFDLHAGLVVPAGQRERLERVCRYALRPPRAGPASAECSACTRPLGPQSIATGARARLSASSISYTRSRRALTLGRAREEGRDPA